VAPIVKQEEVRMNKRQHLKMFKQAEQHMSGLSRKEFKRSGEWGRIMRLLNASWSRQREQRAK
jgi:Txe/YoeB family toxin of Txe-Axe toxin-antitoxin module